MRACCECGKALAADWLPGVCPCCFRSVAGAEARADRAAGEPAPRLGPGGWSLPVCEDFAGRYKFLDERATSRGGQGLIFRVRDHHLGRVVALKRLAEQYVGSRAAESQFLREARIAGQLSHPGFLPVFDLGLDPLGRPFFTTVLLRGRTLDEVVRQVRADGHSSELAFRRALEVAHRICENMAYAHSRGVVHCDLKPSNVLLGDHGEVFVVDLGAASAAPGAASDAGDSQFSANPRTAEAAVSVAADANESSQPTDGPATVFGTLPYAPPEKLRAPQAPGDPRMDIYAVGVMLYELCVGRLPYSDSAGELPPAEDLRQLILAGPPTLIRRLRHSVSSDVAAIAGKAMAYDPVDRYQSMEELARDIRAFLDTRVVRARRPGPVAKFYKWAVRNGHRLALAALVFGAVGISVTVAFRLKSEKDHAQQLTALRDAELAARRGQWRSVIDHLARAEEAGYRDRIHLGLKRLAAWRALSVSEAQSAQAELDKLLAEPDLGPYRAVVLLSQGEYELGDKATFDFGIQHVREALAVGLDPANEAFARGLIAVSTLEAIERFHLALRLDPYHYGAHQHSLSLEFVLGRYSEFESHVRVCEILFPQDPSPKYLQATRLALEGHLEDARNLISSLPESANPVVSKLFVSILPFLASASAQFDVEVDLGAKHVAEPQADAFLTNLVSIYLASKLEAERPSAPHFRMAQLPCIKAGLEDGIQALKGLMLPFLSLGGDPVERIKSACRHHPEATLPFFAARLLASQQPTAPERLRAALQAQAELYQMAAALPSILPKVPRLARFHAARSYFSLATKLSAVSADARQICIQHLRAAAREEEISAAECREYFGFAFRLKELDLARVFLTRWEQLEADEAALIHSRIELELASGAYGNALRLIDGLLAKNPEEAWAVGKRKESSRNLRSLVESLERTVQPEK